MLYFCSNFKVLASYLAPLKLYDDNVGYLKKSEIIHAMKIGTKLYSRWFKVTKDIAAKSSMNRRSC